MPVGSPGTVSGVGGRVGIALHGMPMMVLRILEQQPRELGRRQLALSDHGKRPKTLGREDHR